MLQSKDRQFSFVTGDLVGGIGPSDGDSRCLIAARTVAFARCSTMRLCKIGSATSGQYAGHVDRTQGARDRV